MAESGHYLGVMVMNQLLGGEVCSNREEPEVATVRLAPSVVLVC